MSSTSTREAPAAAPPDLAEPACEPGSGSSPTPTAPAGRRTRRLLRWLLGTAAVALLVAGGLLALLLHRLDGLAEVALRRRLAELDADLGRSLSFGAIRISLGLTVGVEVTDLRLRALGHGTGEGPSAGPTAGTAAEIASLASLRLSLEVGPLLRSRGRHMVVREIRLSRPRLRLWRRSDGELAVAGAAGDSSGQRLRDLIARLQAAVAASRARAARQPAGPAPVLRSGRLERLRIEEGTLQLLGEAHPLAGGPRRPQPGTAAGSAVLLEMTHIQLVTGPLGEGRTVELEGKAALLASAPNVRLRARLPWPAVSTAGPVARPGARVELSVTDLGVEPLARLGPVLPMLGLAGARISGTVSVDRAGPEEPWRSSAQLRLAGACLLGRSAGPSGGPHPRALPAPRAPDCTSPQAGQVRDWTLSLAVAAATVRHLKFSSVELRAAGLAAQGRLEILDPALPSRRVRAELELRGQVEDAVELLPPSWRGPLVAAGPELSGPFVLRGELGERLEGAVPSTTPTAVPTAAVSTPVRLEVDLDGVVARRTRPLLVKPAGLPLRLLLRARLPLQTGAEPPTEPLLLDELNLVAGPVQLRAHGQLRQRDDLELRIDELRVELGPTLKRLSELLRRTGPLRAEGQLLASGSLRRRGSELSGTLQLGLQGVRATARRFELQTLPAPGGQVRGELAFRYDLREHRRHLRAELDLSAAALALGPLRKPPGQVAELAFELQADGVDPSRASLKGGRLRLAGLRLSGVEASLAGDHVKLEVGSALLELGPLGRLLVPGALEPPVAATLEGLAAVKLDLALTAAGQRTQPGSVDWHVTLKDSTAPWGKLRGHARGRGLQPPARVEVELEADDLLLPRPAGAPTAAAAGGPTAPTASAPLLERLARLQRLLETTRLTLRLKLGRLRLGSAASASVSGAAGAAAGGAARPPGLLFTDVTTELHGRRGRLDLERLRLGALGGTVDLGGTTVELRAGAPRLWLRGRLERIDLAELARLAPAGPRAGASAAAPGPRIRSGRASLKLDVSTEGTSAEALAKHLNGSLQGEVSQVDAHVVFQRRVRPKRKVLARLLERVRRRQDRSGKRAEADVKIVSGQVHLVARGGDLFTHVPLVLKTADAQVTVAGRLGRLGVSEREQAVDLQIKLLLWPEAVEKATQGRLVPARAVPLSAHLTGTRAAPLVEFEDVWDTLRALRGTRLHRRVENLTGPPPEPDSTP